ncbi:MAG: metallophosphoesterase family protein [Burkholderiales bacterium]|nr:metallophosphoesterase family protein [Burkholderiales bacterium]
MKIAAISDIHGNLPALEAVLADIETQAVDATVNLGDILSGPLWIAETADRLMALKLPTISGNHERQVLTVPPDKMGASDAHAAARVNSSHRAWMSSLPATLQLTGEVFCCHGTPTSDLVYFLETVTPDCGEAGVRRATLSEATERAGSAMRGVAHGVILCGHTHVPRVMRLADGRLVVNPGSVGLQAYDDDHPHVHLVENGSPHSRYAILTRLAAGWQVELRNVPYDHEQVAQFAEANARPDWADALRTGFVGRRETSVAPLSSGPSAGGLE